MTRALQDLAFSEYLFVLFLCLAMFGGYLSHTLAHGTLRIVVGVIIFSCSLWVALAGQMPNLWLFILFYGVLQGRTINIPHAVYTL